MLVEEVGDLLPDFSKGRRTLSGTDIVQVVTTVDYDSQCDVDSHGLERIPQSSRLRLQYGRVLITV